VRFTNLVRDENGWETRSTTTHFADGHLAVVTEMVQTPTRSEPKAWTIVHRKAAVVIAPMTADGKFLLVQQERVPIRSAIWEMPAGQIDDIVEPDPKKIAEVALRELREETGHELASDGELIPLGHYFSSPGFTDEHGYFFLARPVEPCAGDAVGDEAESILDCRAFTVEELRRMIAQNEIRDANTLSICARLSARGFLRLDPRD
jgi:8-oxo-dGTP pyrophosphatase MutT (NUDIX family)